MTSLSNFAKKMAMKEMSVCQKKQDWLNIYQSGHF
jgi:hypothetical protein